MIRLWRRWRALKCWEDELAGTERMLEVARRRSRAAAAIIRAREESGLTPHARYFIELDKLRADVDKLNERLVELIEDGPDSCQDS